MNYLGFRIEISNNILTRNWTRKFSSKHCLAHIDDMHKEGKITIERLGNMLIAHGQKADYKTGLSNFSLTYETSSDNEELFRIVQIMNVLGNDRLIKEKVNSFINGKSLLCALPQLDPIKTAIVKIDQIIPGFIRCGWYYAPEALFDV
ncbi:MAG: hypothetical protein WC523_00115 [Patescibacteria group bacterium]